MKKILLVAFFSVIAVTTCYIPTRATLINPKPAIDPTTNTITKEQAIKNALAEFKSLSRKERNMRFKEAKAVLKKYKAAKRAGDTTDADTKTILMVVLSIILPPLAVYLKQNATDGKFVLDLILALVGIIGFLTLPILGWLLWLAAIVYALIVVVG
jgi:Uncharacterized protein family UPF0057.